MKKELVIAWMDKLIDEWYQMRLIRTLAYGGGNEYASYIGISADMEFHISFGEVLKDEEEIEKLASMAGSKLIEEKIWEHSSRFYFLYRGFKFFVFINKEENR